MTAEEQVARVRELALSLLSGDYIIPMYIRDKYEAGMEILRKLDDRGDHEYWDVKTNEWKYVERYDR